MTKEKKAKNRVKLEILKKGGKKALKEFNETNRVPASGLNTATKVIESKKYRKEKYPAYLAGEA